MIEVFWITLAVELGDKMRTSEQLLEALMADDAAKSLNSLVKSNKGKWKSKSQAKYLLKKIRDEYQTAEAVKWARQQGLYDKGTVAAEIVSSIKGYGYRDPSKVRYTAQVFVLDGRGVIARAKFKYKHYTKKTGTAGGVVWNTGQVTFQREDSDSEQYVDLEKEDAEARRKRNAEKKEAAKQAALIKNIPDWKQQDILVDFMDRLEGGWPLTPNQLAVVQNKLPMKEVFIGKKEDWTQSYNKFKKQVVRVAKIFKELDVYNIGLEAQKNDDPFSEFGMGESPPDAEKEAKRFDDFITSFQSGRSYQWPDSQIFDLVADIVYGSRRQDIRKDAFAFGDIDEYYKKAIKTKRPSKISMRVITYISRAAEKLKSVSDSKIQKMLAEKYQYELPVKSVQKPSEQLKKSIGFTIPSPSKFGFQKK